MHSSYWTPWGPGAVLGQVSCGAEAGLGSGKARATPKLPPSLGVSNALCCALDPKGTTPLRAASPHSWRGA